MNHIFSEIFHPSLDLQPQMCLFKRNLPNIIHDAARPTIITFAFT